MDNQKNYNKSDDGRFRNRPCPTVPTPVELIDSGLSSKSICLWTTIKRYIDIPLEAGGKWTLHKNHLLSVLKKRGEGKKTFENAMRELRENGWIWQFRIPVGEKGQFIYEYELKYIPDTTYTGVINCDRYGVPITKTVAAGNAGEQANNTAGQDGGKSFEEKYKELLAENEALKKEINKEQQEKQIKKQKVDTRVHSEPELPKQEFPEPEQENVISAEIAADKIKENCNYNTWKNNKDELSALKQYALNTMIKTFESGANTYKINGKIMPIDVVRLRFLRINDDMLSIVCRSIEDKQANEEIRNLKSYMIAALYNIIDDYVKYNATRKIKTKASYNLSEFEKNAIKNTPKNNKT